MIGIPVGLLVANAAEWLTHKYVLHGVGKRKTSVWHFHWNEHHRACRKGNHRDPDYERSVFGNHAQGKEALALALAAASQAPLLPVAPFYVGTLWYSTWKVGASMREVRRIGRVGVSSAI